MTEKPTGVFVRLPLSEDQAHTFLKESSHAWDECNGSSDGLACTSGLFAIGTLVTGGELPTAIFRVREHSADNSNAWAYHKAPPSDQDASEYELEVERLLTHEQALTLLATRDAEIARLQSENMHQRTQIVEMRNNDRRIRLAAERICSDLNMPAFFKSRIELRKALRGED